mmetsp:Transcript_2025/g.4560  ORF Transcript_2025/g.4560 Transcript_2025/m.4560 type:complete len:212 (+) Transcript_2025:286-921(+)
MVLGDEFLVVHGRQVRVRRLLERARIDRNGSPGSSSGQLQEGPKVASCVQVVRGTEDAQQLVVIVLVAVRLHLMGTDDQLQVVLPNELLGNVGPEHENALTLPVRGAISGASSWVCPQEVNDHSLVCFPLLLLASSIIHCPLERVGRELCVSIDHPDLIQGTALDIDRHRVLGIVGLARKPDARHRTRKPSMDHQDLLIDKVKQGQVPEGL